jgi:hypothetical protein
MPARASIVVRNLGHVTMSRAVEKFLEECGPRLRATVEKLRAQAVADRRAASCVSAETDALQRRVVAEEHRLRAGDWSGDGNPWLVFNARVALDAARRPALQPGNRFAVGELVSTRGGRRARILATDLAAIQPIVAAVEPLDEGGEETVETYYANGRYRREGSCGWDLVPGTGE